MTDQRRLEVALQTVGQLHAELTSVRDRSTCMNQDARLSGAIRNLLEAGDDLVRAINTTPRTAA